MYDLHNNIQILGQVIGQVSDNTAQTFDIDRKGFNAIQYLITLGTLADVDATFTVLVEDSADDVTYAAVTDDFLLGIEAMGLDFADDDKTAKIGYVGGKRYVRITLTPANNTGAADISIIGIGASPIRAPKTTQVV